MKNSSYLNSQPNELSSLLCQWGMVVIETCTKYLRYDLMLVLDDVQYFNSISEPSLEI
jgi:hypothetical protein